MATAAERQRRSRAHKRGEHGLCDPARCDARAGVTRPVDAGASVTPAVTTPAAAAAAEPDPVAPHRPGEIETEVAEFVAQLQFDDGDPRRVLARIAVMLARKVDAASATAGAVRELTVLLGQLAEIPEQPAGPLDGIRARKATRRINQLVQRAS
ncbi:MAG TPA: hypothetical protein VFM37_13535 [Pseudonocardiaceae bacterium]|nr:hypothetical protein [Pseudonocardiaceae bacterium]